MTTGSVIRLEVSPLAGDDEGTRVNANGMEDEVTESFLTQLEQRTQQVKITLANLEAEKTRIEGLIAQLQPLVPQYDALVSAERSLANASIELEPLGAEQQNGPKSWEEQHQPSWQQQQSGGEQQPWNN